MAAICAAPAICFEPKGFLEGYAATAHPNFVDELGGSLLEKNIYKECRVVVDTQIVTSRGPGTSMEWALCLVEQLYGSKKAREVAAPMVVQPANARLRQNLEWRLDETPLE
jgi:4-methyl-5(b-hydroxyethyl)-thiazole monophosphate biosynthesis